MWYCKGMIACFFGFTEHVTTVTVDNLRTVDTNWHTNFVNLPIIGEIRKNQNLRVVHHDNKCHSAYQTINFIFSKVLV